MGPGQARSRASKDDVPAVRAPYWSNIRRSSERQPRPGLLLLIIDPDIRRSSKGNLNREPLSIGRNPRECVSPGEQRSPRPCGVQQLHDPNFWLAATGVTAVDQRA